MRILDERDTDPPGAAAAVAGLFAARYPELVRLAGLLGADDPEDIAHAAGKEVAVLDEPANP